MNAETTDGAATAGTGSRIRRLAADRRIRYLAVGAISAGIYYGFFSAGFLLFGHHISGTDGIAADVIAVLASFVTAVLSYPLYRVGVFSGRGPWISGFLKFYVIAFWNLLWSLVGLPVLIEVVGIPALIAQALLLAAIPLLNYPVHLIWTFRQRDRR